MILKIYRGSSRGKSFEVELDDETYARLCAYSAALGLEVADALHRLLSDIVADFMTADALGDGLTPEQKALVLEHLIQQRTSSGRPF